MASPPVSPIEPGVKTLHISDSHEAPSKCPQPMEEGTSPSLSHISSSSPAASRHKRLREVQALVDAETSPPPPCRFPRRRHEVDHDNTTAADFLEEEVAPSCLIAPETSHSLESPPKKPRRMPFDWEASPRPALAWRLPRGGGDGGDDGGCGEGWRRGRKLGKRAKRSRYLFPH